MVLMKSFDSANVKIIPIIKDTLIHYGKLHFDPTPLIGECFGSIFEIKDKSMTKVDDFEKFNNELSENVSSRLSSIKDKSAFSQEKIIKKKKQRNHSNIVTVMRPTVLLINEMFYSRDKIGGMRPDILAQLMTFSNIQNGSRCLIVDHNLGMVLSAVMSRILPDGICIQLVQGKEMIQTTRRTMNMLNIRESDHLDSLFAISIRDFYKVSKDVDSFVYENNILRAQRQEHLARLSQLAHSKRDVEKDEKMIERESTTEQLQQTLIKKDASREMHNKERIEASRHLKTRSLDSLILVAQYDHPLSLLKLTYPFLAPSKQFVIYSDTISPLLECHEYLKSNSLAVSLNLSESWLRKYQVLPDRTRPEMNISGYGGYLFSGTKALYGPDIKSEVRGAAN